MVMFTGHEALIGIDSPPPLPLKMPVKNIWVVDKYNGAIALLLLKTQFITSTSVLFSEVRFAL